MTLNLDEIEALAKEFAWRYFEKKFPRLANEKDENGKPYYIFERSDTQQAYANGYMVASTNLIQAVRELSTELKFYADRCPEEHPHYPGRFDKMILLRLSLRAKSVLEKWGLK